MFPNSTTQAPLKSYKVTNQFGTVTVSAVGPPVVKDGMLVFSGNDAAATQIAGFSLPATWIDQGQPPASAPASSGGILGWFGARS